MYLNRQIENGADTVMIFDSWGGILSDNLYHKFSLPYLQKIVNNIHKNYNGKAIINIVFTKGAGIWLDSLITLDTNAIGLDWTIDIGHAKTIVKNKVALQGNLDPAILSVADRDVIRQEVTRILDSYRQANNGEITGHVFNFGHGILPSANPDNVAYLVDIVHEISATF
jgi:uroporphyrinogen decarboxylase